MRKQKPRRISGREYMYPALLAVLLLGAWNAPLLAQENALRPVTSKKIHNASQKFTEPSGIAIAADGRTFYAVSDNVNAIFALNEKGEILRRFDLDFKAGDLEGIAINPDGQILALQEGLGRILVIDANAGRLVATVKLKSIPGYDDIRGYLAGAPKSKGFEGIAVHPETGAVFVVHEGQPRMLLEISPDYSAIPRAWLLGAKIGFVSPHANDKELDVSGLTIDPRTGRFLIVSDTGKSLFEFDTQT